MHKSLVKNCNEHTFQKNIQTCTNCAHPDVTHNKIYTYFMLYEANVPASMNNGMWLFTSDAAGGKAGPPDRPRPATPGRRQAGPSHIRVTESASESVQALKSAARGTVCTLSHNITQLERRKGRAAGPPARRPRRGQMNCEVIAGSSRRQAAGGPSHITESTGESVQVCPRHGVHIIT